MLGECVNYVTFPDNYIMLFALLSANFSKPNKLLMSSDRIRNFAVLV